MRIEPSVSLGERIAIFGGAALYYSFATLVLMLLVLPILVIIPMSFTSTSFLIFPPQGFSIRWYKAYFNRHDWVGPTILSIQVATGVAILSTLIATPAAFALVRGRFWEKRLMYVIMLMPIMIPVIISAIAIYFVLARAKLVGTTTGLILAHTVLALPREVLVISAVTRGFNQQLEIAARSLGASRWKTLRYVTLPLLSYGILAGAVVAFVTSFDEVIVAIFISGASAVTLPRRMWDSVQVGYDPTMVAASSLLITFAVVIVVVGMLLRRRA
jgi:putative spermidine/putrescine transport system permease protein